MSLPDATVRMIRSRRRFGFTLDSIARETGLCVTQVAAALKPPSRLTPEERHAIDVAERKQQRAIERAGRRIAAVRDELLRVGCTPDQINQAFGLLQPRRPIPLAQQPRVPRS